MEQSLNGKNVKHLAILARVDLKAGEEKKMVKDLQAILNYFKELQEVDTSAVKPMTGGTTLKNVVREDVTATDDTGKGRDAFPDKYNGALKVPPVF
ncbi:MAG: Asp-tRNA(Asn)/Glu-tRNA(Gln) amidotransferase subunit GatC [bacterium]|nr:Asp-tRNA(Asn)/Glu-tRNA(Gln) amidotransferase subunit GatC [bacterium]